jgi:excisionase family DNA binding protein
MNEAQTIASENLAGSTDYFSVSELAEMLGLHAATIRLWIREERLPSARKDGRRYLIQGDEIAQLLAATPTLGYAHRPAREARRELEASVDAGPRPQETGARALATGLLQRGLS